MMKTIDSTVKKICEQPIVKKIHKRREASREKILQVSIELFYDAGYDKTTARQIAQRSGILIGSLYNIFSSKEEIFKAIIMGAYNEALDESEEIVRERGDYFSAVIFPGA
jgi:AcrR family transcriptional regulator